MSEVEEMMLMVASTNPRPRGRILTDKGYNKINEAIAKWEEGNGKKCSVEDLKYKTNLDDKTIRKIRERKKGCDETSIRCFFRVFGLTLEEDDYEFPNQKQTPSESGQSEEAQPAAGLDDGLTRWVGREKLIDDLIAKLLGNCRVLSLVGITGIGKTSLADQLTRQPQIKAFLPQLFVVDFYQESLDFQVVAQRVLGENLASQSELLQNEDAMVREMVHKLQSEPCLLVLDMLEVLLQADDRGGHGFEQPVFGKFLDAVVSVPEMRSRLILTSQYRPPVGAEGRFLERHHTEAMKGLDRTEARMLFAVWDVQINSDGDGEYLDRMIAVYEGHPLALRVIAGEIRSRYEGDIQAFWDEYGYEIEEVERLKTATEGDPKDDRPNLTFSISLDELVRRRIESSVARLREDNSLAYRLFCMGGTNRQAVPRRQWLFLIGEVPRDEQNLAFATLQRRFLLEEERIERKVFYRLHNLIRGVALEGLRELEREELEQEDDSG